MKKKIFLSGVNAKLALAAVALTSVMFTSCEKEEFKKKKKKKKKQKKQMLLLYMIYQMVLS